MESNRSKTPSCLVFEVIDSLELDSGRTTPAHLKKSQEYTMPLIKEAKKVDEATPEIKKVSSQDSESETEKKDNLFSYFYPTFPSEEII